MAKAWVALSLPKARTWIAVMMLSAIAWGQNVADPEAADKVFSMANEIRVAAGLPPLTRDQHINDAATFHAIEFAKSETPADQYPFEPWLIERLKMAEVRAGAAGEILVRTPDLDHVPAKLKTDESVQKVLLNPKFTLAGFAAIHNGPWLYIVGDLIRLLENLSTEDVEDLVVQIVEHRRTARKIAPYAVRPMHQLRERACEMAKKDSLKLAPVDPYLASDATSFASNFRVLTFTTPDPRVLSDSIQGPANDPKLNTLSVGACFSSSKTYPSGTYWIALEFYDSRNLRE